MCTAAIAALALFAPLAAQDRLTVDRARYDQETDPVRKARALVKLGDDQIDEARKQLKDGDEIASLHTLEQYRDEVRETVAGLQATGVDPEKKPAGFKELQISLRETVRHIDDLILTLPVDKRPFFREVRTDLVKTQNELIDALFPRKPDKFRRTRIREESHASQFTLGTCFFWPLVFLSGARGALRCRKKGIFERRRSGQDSRCRDDRPAHRAVRDIRGGPHQETPI